MGRRSLSVGAVIPLLACYGPPLQPPPASTAENRAEVVFIRPAAANAGGLPVAVGFDQQTLAVLQSGEYAVVGLPANTYRFFVQVRTTPLHGLPPEVTVLERPLPPGDRLCILAAPDPQNAWRAAVPVLPMLVGPKFTLQQVPCPSAAELARYKPAAGRSASGQVGALGAGAGPGPKPPRQAPPL